MSAKIIRAGSLVATHGTLSAAKAAAIAGDLIIVSAGNYDEHDLLKHGVNWYFADGANVAYTGNAGAVFDDHDARVQSSIYGAGSFQKSGDTLAFGSNAVFRLGNYDSRLAVWCKEIKSLTPTPGSGQNTTPLDISCAWSLFAASGDVQSLWYDAMILNNQNHTRWVNCTVYAANISGGELANGDGMELGDYCHIRVFCNSFSGSDSLVNAVGGAFNNSRIDINAQTYGGVPVVGTTLTPNYWAASEYLRVTSPAIEPVASPMLMSAGEMGALLNLDAIRAAARTPSIRLGRTRR